MSRLPGSRLLLLLVVAIACQEVPAARAAGEPAREFLEGLRLRGDYEEAFNYLEAAKTNPLVPDAFKETIDYEAGVTLMQWSLLAEGVSQRESRLQDAAKRFARFLAEHPNHKLAGAARMQSGNVLVEFGRIQVEEAARPSTTPEEKTRLREAAREKYREAEKMLIEAEKHFTEEHAKFPKTIDPRKTAVIEQRLEVRKNMVSSRLLIASVCYEIAQTFLPGSPEHKKQLTEAADRYDALYEKYKAFLCGFYAHLWHARCLKELGDAKGAIAICHELLLGPDAPRAFRELKTKAVILAMEAHLLLEDKQYEEVVKLGGNWFEHAAADEESTPDGLAIRYHLGAAAWKLAEPLPKNNAQRREYSLLAARHLRFVARFPGEHQQEAQQWIERHVIPGAGGADP